MAISNLFLSSILVAAFLGITSAHDTWLEGSIFCERNGEWSPLEGATASVICGFFTVNAKTSKGGYFLENLPENTDICVVSLEYPGPNSDDCVVADPENSFDMVKRKYEDENVVIYTAKPLLYNPFPTAATPIYSALPPTSPAKTPIPSVKP